MHTYQRNDFRKTCRKDFNQIYSSIKTEQNNKYQKNIIAHQSKTPIIILKFWMLRFYYFFCSWQKDENVPHFGKYAAQNTLRNTLHNHRGTATIEAVCIMPILLAAFWAVYSMGQLYILDNQIYHATMNAAEELAEKAYLTQESEWDIGKEIAAEWLIRSQLSENKRIEQYVVNGKNGIRVLPSVKMDEEDFVCIQVKYRIQVPIPWMQELQKEIKVQVRQKAYTGYQLLSPASDSERYVYLAEYSSVYHCSRSCTHLLLSVHPVSMLGLQTTYKYLIPCEYCGEEATTGIYYVTDTGNCYHTSRQCSGLKRTVRRVPLSEAIGYGACSRCGQ